MQTNKNNVIWKQTNKYTSFWMQTNRNKCYFEAYKATKINVMWMQTKKLDEMLFGSKQRNKHASKIPKIGTLFKSIILL